MTDIDRTTMVRRCDDEISVDVNGGFILMSAENDEFYDLNRTATAIWKLLESPATVAELEDHLVAAYDVEPSVCRRQVIELLGALADRGMITVVR